MFSVNKVQQARWTFWRSCWRGKERGRPRSESALRPPPPSARELRAGVHWQFLNTKTNRRSASRVPLTATPPLNHGPRPPAAAAVADPAARPRRPPATRRRPAAAAAPRPDTPRRPRHSALAAIDPVAVRHMGGRAQGSPQEEDVVHEEAHTLHGWQGSQGPHKPEQMLCMRQGEAGSLPVSLLC